MSLENSPLLFHHAWYLLRRFIEPSVVVLTKTAYTVSESVGQLQVEVLRQGSVTGILTVTYEATDLTATFGADYSGNQGVVVFGNGENTKYITFYIVPDKVRC